MKPCDCRTLHELKQLNEQGIGFNNYKFTHDGGGVFIDIEPYVRIKIPTDKMKAFAEWFLEDQAPARKRRIK